MGCKHAKRRQPGVIGRLLAWLRLAQENRHLAEALDAVIARQKIAIAAIYQDGVAEGRLAERLHPARGHPGERHLHAVPSINRTGTLGQKVRHPGPVERGQRYQRLQWARPAAGLPGLQGHRVHPGQRPGLGQAQAESHPGGAQAPADVTVERSRRLKVAAQPGPASAARRSCRR